MYLEESLRKPYIQYLCLLFQMCGCPTQEEQTNSHPVQEDHHLSGPVQRWQAPGHRGGKVNQIHTHTVGGGGGR